MKVNNIQVAYNRTATNAVSNNSFRGVGTKVGNANKWAMKHLANGGFFLEFCLMDLCGLVLPRVYQGFQRNKKELGHLNYTAGFEELIREGTTGPSMFLIPIAAVILAGKLLGKATQVSFNFLQQFSDSFKSLGERYAIADNKTTQRAFAGKLFDKFFVQSSERIMHPENSAVKPLEEFREEFVNRLTKGLGETTQNGNKSLLERFKAWRVAKAEKGKQLASFMDLVSEINASHFNREHASAIYKAGKGRTLTSADLFLDARKYMEDIIPSAKLTFNDILAKSTKTIKKDVFEKVINSLTNARHNGRELLCLGGTAALVAFLCIIPKLYQLSKKNPALNGFETKNNREVA